MNRFLHAATLLLAGTLLCGCVSDGAGRIPTAEEAPGVETPASGKGPPPGYGLPEERP